MAATVSSKIPRTIVPVVKSLPLAFMKPIQVRSLQRRVRACRDGRFEGRPLRRLLFSSESSHLESPSKLRWERSRFLRTCLQRSTSSASCEASCFFFIDLQRSRKCGDRPWFLCASGSPLRSCPSRISRLLPSWKVSRRSGLSREPPPCPPCRFIFPGSTEGPTSVLVLLQLRLRRLHDLGLDVRGDHFVVAGLDGVGALAGAHGAQGAGVVAELGQGNLGLDGLKGSH
jgi:hypothetical protein